MLLDAVTQAKRIYYGLYLNMEARRVNREQRAIAETLVDVVTGRLASGMAMHHDVLKMQTEASMLDDDLAMLEAERREMAAMVNALRDLSAAERVGEPLEAWSPEVPLDGATLVSRALAQRPEVQEMAAMAEARRAMAAVARREYYPDVMVGAFYDARRGGEDMIGGMVTVSVPLWLGRKQRIDVAVADRTPGAPPGRGLGLGRGGALHGLRPGRRARTKPPGRGEGGAPLQRPRLLLTGEAA